MTRLEKQDDMGKAFEKLVGDMYYKYRGYRAEKLPNGNVLCVLRELNISEFHEFVDGIYLDIEKSISKAFNSIQSPNK